MNMYHEHLKNTSLVMIKIETRTFTVRKKQQR